MNIFIVSAPSGSGKSTLLRGVFERDRNLVFSISYTTRDPRGKEVHGEDYFFLTREEFERELGKEAFLEWADVFGYYYGTHRRFLDQAEAEGKDLVLDIDVQGARQLRQKFPDAVSVFILPPSRDELEKRLRARSEDSEETIRRRLRGAAGEIRRSFEYDHVIVNREVEEATDQLAAIFNQTRRLRQQREDQIRPILEDFERPFEDEDGEDK
jgi:guanylate kinase